MYVNKKLTAAIVCCFFSLFILVGCGKTADDSLTEDTGKNAEAISETDTQAPSANSGHTGKLTKIDGTGPITVDMPYSEVKKTLDKSGFKYVEGDLTLDTQDGTAYLFWSNNKETRLNRIIFSETAEGLKLGDSVDKMKQIYGEQSAVNTNSGIFYFYLSGRYQLTIRAENNKVIGMSYGYIQLHYPENGKLSVQSPFSGSFTQAEAMDKNHEYPVKYTAAKGTRECMVQIAESQVGYVGGSFSGGNISFPYQRADGWSKYGASMGMPVGAWCASFVSWCADMAEIPQNQLERLITANMNWNDFRDRESYAPRRGDLIYFRYNGFDNPVTYANHIGIVAQYDADTKTVLTVEGNTRGGQVVRRAYRLNDAATDVRGFSAVRF